MHLTGSTVRARQLRRAMTKPERLLWWALRDDRAGTRFRRSHPVGPYVLDFYCAPANLCVEVDGPHHEFTAEHDSERDNYLEKRGVRTLRVRSEDVLRNLEGVVQYIRLHLPPPSAAAAAATSPRFPGEEQTQPLPREPGGAVAEGD